MELTQLSRASFIIFLFEFFRTVFLQIQLKEQKAITGFDVLSDIFCVGVCRVWSVEHVERCMRAMRWHLSNFLVCLFLAPLEQNKPRKQEIQENKENGKKKHSILFSILFLVHSV